jgi:glutathione S-transferase
MPITIHGTAKSRAVRTIWMAEELGLPYVHDPVDFRDGGASTEAFRSMNDLEQVPVISDGDLTMSESLAINLYLARKHGGPVAPRDLAEEAMMLKWTLFGATQIEPRGVVVMLNTIGRPEAERDGRAVEAAIGQTARAFGHLDRALAKGGGHLVGGRFTAADLNVAACVFYFRAAPEAIAAFGDMARWWAALQERPAFKKAMAMREAA